MESSQELMRHSRWDSISVSLHHYDLKKLSQIYGVEIPNKALAFDGIDMNKINASCNLVKGYIDSNIVYFFVEQCKFHCYFRFFISWRNLIFSSNEEKTILPSQTSALI